MMSDPLVILIIGAIPVGVFGLWAAWQVWCEEHRREPGQELPNGPVYLPDRQLTIDAPVIRLGAKEDQTKQVGFRVSLEEHYSVHATIIPRRQSLGDYFMSLHFASLAKGNPSDTNS